ncbi:hypothetical protein H0H87_004154 [Tephrocybe sp. NHM501043]|nr:hypothetical protein H0H87_004154 [Tephrocybe sp. NHM501043]
MSIPDAQIFPHATGLAEKLVAAHQEPQDLVYHAGWFCPYVQRGWIALEEKGIKYQYKEVNPYKKEQHFLDINPKGLVPAVEYKGRAIYESLVICEFFEDLYPTQKPLLPADPVSRAHARIWIDFISKSIVPASGRLIQAQDAAKQTEYLGEYAEALRKYVKEVKGPYFFGEEFSLVDIALAPWIIRDYVIQEHRGFSREQVNEAWVKYAAVVEKRKSVVETQSRPQHLAIHLKLVSTPQKQDETEAYVGWTGMASASSLTHFSSAPSTEKTLETVEIDPQYAQGLGLSQGDLVEIGLLHDLPLAQSVATEPLTSDDWDIIEIHASHVESTLLSQVRVAKAGQEIDVWVMGRTRVRLRVVSIDPSSKGGALLLTTNTEVSIAPKLHRSDRQADTKPRAAKSLHGTPEDASSKVLMHGPCVLRVLPRGISHVALPDYSGPELVGFVSVETYKQLIGSKDINDGSLISCSQFILKRIAPPHEPTISSSPPPIPPPLPIARIIKSSASDKENMNDDTKRKDMIFVGSLADIPDSHIVFPAAPGGVEDWDIIMYVNIENSREQPCSIRLDRLFSSDDREHLNEKLELDRTPGTVPIS